MAGTRDDLQQYGDALADAVRVYLHRMKRAGGAALPAEREAEGALALAAARQCMVRGMAQRGFTCMARED